MERLKNCMGIHDMRAMVIAFVSTIEQSGQRLHDGVPRTCHVCGHGEYQPEVFGDDNAVKVQFWKGQNINLRTLRLFVCNGCGHVDFFRTASG